MIQLTCASSTSPRPDGMIQRITWRRRSTSWCSKGSSRQQRSGLSRGIKEESCIQAMHDQRQGILSWVYFARNIRRLVTLHTPVWTPTLDNLQNWSMLTWQRTRLWRLRDASQGDPVQESQTPSVCIIGCCASGRRAVSSG